MFNVKENDCLQCATVISSQKILQIHRLITRKRAIYSEVGQSESEGEIP